MSTLNEIANRHGRDRWKDLLFIGAAVLLAAVAIGSTTSKAVGTHKEATYSLTVVESNLEITR